MPKSVDAIRELVAQDQLDVALDELSDLVEPSNSELQREVIVLRQRLSTARKRRRLGVASTSDDSRIRTELADSILQLVDEIALTPTATPESAALLQRGRPLVFISYAHVDRLAADRLKEGLERQGLAVRIDYEDLQPGEPIRLFIARSVRESNLTVSIVSSKSLLSTWVAMEVIKTLNAEELTGKNRFIAGYLDTTLFDRSYRLQATEEIDLTISKIDELAASYAEQKLDTNDLNDERTRLFDLRGNLGTILAHLRGSLTLSLENENFDTTVTRIAGAVKSSIGKHGT